MNELFDIPGPEAFADEMSDELTAILNWWIDRMWDPESRSWHGRMSGTGDLDPMHPRSIILYTRLLWTYSAAARRTAQANYRTIADFTFQYLENHFWDNEHGGLYWMVDAQGNPLDTKKQVYAQAFGIYAYSEYHLLTGSVPALDRAEQLFTLIEKHSFDGHENGYLEAFDRHWHVLSDMRLSAKDANTAKTMNTHLHLLEAYTNFARTARKDLVIYRLHNLIQLFADHFIDPEEHRLVLFFDEHWNRKEDLTSYGHDIEASWLLTEACDVVNDPILIGKMHQVSLHLVEAVIKNGLAPDGGLWYEWQDEHLDQDRHWWPQIEGVIGLINAWQIVRNPYYFLLAYRLWEYIKDHLLDRDHGEWYWSIHADGTPNLKEDKAGPWKANYHNGRGCMELMDRLMS